MNKDYLEALVDITKKLKLRPQLDARRYVINPAGRIRKVSNHSLLDAVANQSERRKSSEFGRLRSGSNDSPLMTGGNLDSPTRMRKVSSHSLLSAVQENDSCFSSSELEQCQNMTLSEKLDFVKKLQADVREQDQALAKQFLQIYKDIQQTKVQKSCIQHQDLLDALFDDSEIEKETPVVLDKPVKRRSKTLTCGVTRMNIRSQRFSCS